MLSNKNLKCIKSDIFLLVSRQDLTAELTISFLDLFHFSGLSAKFVMHILTLCNIHILLFNSVINTNFNFVTEYKLKTNHELFILI